ncbi:F-box protein At2g02240-like [Mangifera indica]|uniref:F-box protein At2g02240-like n=1 Tax=Mangifera indica TaxID=29780 RepID=UPI001CFBC22B|nr:F-box protein At2g02240-like [Mangifera indica]
MDMSVILPEEYISDAIFYTCARDACKFAVVSTVFKSAADSDAVWEKFLPSDYQEIISGSATPSMLTAQLSRKDPYLHRCHNPIIINNGTMWSSLQESRLGGVAELNFVLWLDVKGKIKTKILPPKTTYGAYLLFKLAESTSGFRTRPVKLGVYLDGIDNGKSRIVHLDPPRNKPTLSHNREDGWMEIEMREFFNGNGDDRMLICSVFDFKGLNSKRVLIVDGIELRPKDGAKELVNKVTRPYQWPDACPAAT